MNRRESVRLLVEYYFRRRFKNQVILDFLKNRHGITISLSTLKGGDMGICGVTVFLFFLCSDAVNKISMCGVAVISNLTACDGDDVSSTLLTVTRCLSSLNV